MSLEHIIFAAIVGTLFYSLIGPVTSFVLGVIEFLLFGWWR